MELAEAGAWVCREESHGVQEEPDLAMLRRLLSLLQIEARLAGHVLCPEKGRSHFIGSGQPQASTTLAPLEAWSHAGDFRGWAATLTQAPRRVGGVPQLQWCRVGWHVAHTRCVSSVYPERGHASQGG